MLRHYDAIGLLRPAVVETASGYRYYSADQLSRLNRIIALKDLGSSLQQGEGHRRRQARRRRAARHAAAPAGPARGASGVPANWVLEFQIHVTR